SSDNRIIGYTSRNKGGVPANFRNYFVIEFDRPFTYKYTFADQSLYSDMEQKANHVGAVIGFRTKKGDVVHAKVASSFISQDQAFLNLKEVKEKSFEKVKSEARTSWNNVLGRIRVEGGDMDQIRTFYSCLYRTSLYPRKFYEYAKEGNIIHYSPYNGEILPGYMYTDVGFWDLFRALYPLYNLLHPSVNKEMQEGLVNSFKESGIYPEWASPGHRDCVTGGFSAAVLVDAYMKGVRVDNPDVMYDGLVKSANSVHPTVSSSGRKAYEYYNRLGYVPYEVVHESATRTLGYSYADWCLYTIAKAMGRPIDEIDLYAKRALNYRNHFDMNNKLMRGRKEDGSWVEPIAPLKWGDAFTEGNAWHYTWAPLHDQQGIIDMMGGKEYYVAMLDSIFMVPPQFDCSYYGFIIHEIREMQIMGMGNYAHGNQPSQHIPYMYNFGGQPWKSQFWVREIMNRMYNCRPDGYCGDEDNGQTSAWYVFSALGFYPVCPGTQQYVLGTPFFKRAEITFENGNKMVLEAPKNSANNRYIQSMTINNRPYRNNYINHNELLNGGVISFEMSATPNYNRGIDDEALPYSFSRTITK
ncbi:MAG: GH92 family glycosyl hydrolase, partial [Bacteroidales bacterium]